MPELPEVETVCRLIRPRIVGQTIERVNVDWGRTLGGQAPRAFARKVKGTTFRSVGRRAKYILLRLDRAGRAAGTLVIHLRMTGRLQVVPRASKPSPWLRVSFDISGQERLEFIDVRKFGRVLFTENEHELLGSLGPEPLEEEFSAEWLRAELKTRRRMLKPLLLDQTFLAGLGNIYVDEALFRAKLHPEGSADRVSPAKAAALHRAIRHTLEAAILREGSSFDTFYRTPEGQPGSYQDQFQVYGRDGKPCLRCGGSLVKIVVGQRGTHLFRRCQPKPRAQPKR